MIKFFYDSLETLQKITFPTKKDYINLTLAIFAVVIVSGIFFVVVDTLVSGAYKAFYTSMRPNGVEQTLQQQSLPSVTGTTTDTPVVIQSGELSTSTPISISGTTN